jgi:fibronectin type 3 domain-containing protein
MYRSPRLCLPGPSIIALVAGLLAGCNDTDVTTVGAAQVSISPPNTSVKVGETTRLAAAVLSSDGVPLSGRPIQWTSLNESIARVDNTGLVTGVAIGVATIRASAEGTSGTSQVTVTSGPAIGATPATVEFTGVRNGASPGDRTVVLTNIGDGTLNGLAANVSYTAGGPTGWLTATLAGTTAPATLVLGATLGNLAVGTYSATVTITSPVASNSPITVPVQLQVLAPAAAIALGTNSVGFNALQGAGNPASQTVSVTNAGGGTLSGLSASVSYAGGQPVGWLSATLGSTTAPTSITLTAITAGLAPGSYSATVRVASPVAANGPQDITVSFTVGAAPPVIGAQPAGLTFTGVSPAAQQVQLTNNGGGSISGLTVSAVYAAGAPSGWLTASLSSATAPATLTVGANGASLAPGNYTATVRITAPGAANSPLDVPVTLTVPSPSPSLALSANTVGFNAVQGAGNPAPQTVGVTNAGGGTLSGLAVSVSYASGQPTGWLSATLGATTAPTAITLTATTGTLPAGSYSATVQVASGVAANSPQNIAVNFVVAAAPAVIGRQPTSLTFTGVTPAAQQIQVTNTGGSTLTGLSVSVIYAAGAPTGWLSTSLSGTTAPASVTVTANGAALASGSYTATVRIAAPGAANSPVDVPVQLNVPPPAIALSLNAVGFSAVQGGGDPAPQTVGITNSGGGTLTGLGVSVIYAPGQSTGWLSAVLGATTAPTGITLSAAIGALQPGNYSATVRVASGVAANSPQDIPVTFTVGAGQPVIGAQPAGLVFTGVSPAPQQILITNRGGGTVSGISVTTSYASGQPTGWLNTSLSGTTAPATLTVSADGATLPPGSYSATLQIAAPGAINSPLVVPITFTVPAPAAAIALSSNSVGFSAVQGGGDPAAQTVAVTNAGGGTLSGLNATVSYGVGQPAGWLTAALGSSTAPTNITLTAVTGSLAAGSYTANVQVTSGVAANSPQNITVTFTVAAPAPAAAIGVQPNSLTFTGVSPAAQQIQLTNTGGGTLSGLAVSVIYPAGPTGWLATSLSGTTAPATLTATASGASLAPGSYTATVQITAPGATNSPVDVPVTFTVPAPAPAIALGANTAAFNAVQGGGDPASQTVTVTNSGGGTLSGLTVSVSYASGQPTGWLSATLGSTTAPTDITLTAATGSLAPGSYSATVQVNSGVAANSPQNIAVTFTVAAPAPAIALASNTVGFSAVEGGADPAAQTVAVTNAGGGTLSGLGVSVSYASGQPTGWLSATLGSTTAPTDITLTAATGSLPAGSYNATVQVASAVASNSPQAITVTFTVAAPAPAVIGAQPTSLTFTGMTPADQLIQLTNSGGGTLSGLAASVTYASGQPTGWLGATLSGTTAPATVTVSASSTSLAAGTYNATVQITAPGATNSPLDVPVTFTVPEAVPGAPTNVTATATSASQIDVAWSGATGNVTEYRIERKTGAAGTWAQIQIVNGSTTGYADTGLSAGTDYFYRVLACNTAGCSAPSTEASATTQASAPTSPTSLSAQGVSTSAIDLQWSHDGLLVTQFEIERGLDQTNFQPLTTTTALARSYQDSGLSGGATFVYRVRACASALCSAWSNTASATTTTPPPAVPGNVSATALSTTQVSVAWDPVAGVTEYRVRRQNTQGGLMTQTFTVAAANTSYVDSGLTTGTGYAYSVQACNQSGCSTFSTPVIVTTP